MSANRFGRLFQILTFGESHGAAMGVVIEGCPSGVRYDEKLLLHCLERRRPGRNQVTSQRQEKDHPEILSGIFDGKTLGTPISVIVRNEDGRSQDYVQVPSAPRVGHADDVWQEKFGFSDPRGGGRSSGRETVARVIGGAFAQMFLQQSLPEIGVTSAPITIGPYRVEEIDVEKFLLGLIAEGDSVGGVAQVVVKNPPRSLGQPVFHKLKTELTSAFMGIGAVTGVELGGGFTLAEKKGTEVHVSSDNSAYGGIRGGISTGEDILLRVAFKPTSSILGVAKRGRHDPCILLRALPVLEAMAYLVLADHVLWARLDS